MNLQRNAGVGCAVLDGIFQQIEQGTGQQRLIRPQHRLFILYFMNQLDAFCLGDGQRLVEHIQHQHGEQRRLELIRLGFGLGQLHEALGQVQGATYLALDLVEQRIIPTDLMPLHIEQCKDRRVRGAQVVGEETQHDAALFFSLTFGTQVREAQQPANRRIAINRQ
ncbi:hypothetical protein D3C76_1217240 [compost metagenome]